MYNKELLIIEVWKNYQNLSKGFAENSWKIKSLGIGFWVTCLTYSYKNTDYLTAVLSIVLVLFFYLMELGNRVIEYKYIYKIISLDRTLESIYNDDVEIFLEDNLSSNISQITIKDYINVILKWRISFQYLIMAFISIILIFYINKNNVHSTREIKVNSLTVEKINISSKEDIKININKSSP